MPVALRRLIAIAALRAGPQDLPASVQLLLAAIAADMATGIAGAASALPLPQAFAVAGLSVGLGIVFTYLVLYLRGLSSRFWQTASALFGTDAIITLVALPLSLALARYVTPEQTAEAPPMLALALLGVLAWNIAVVGRIFRNALNLRALGGFAVGLAYVLLTSGIVF